MKDKTETPPEPRRRYSLFPKSLSSSLEQLVKPVYKKHGFAEHRLLTEWHLIVGPELAAYSQPQKLTGRAGQGGTLYVLVASARALELQHMQPLILQKISTYFGYGAVTRLSFTQTATLLSRRKPAPKPKAKVVPDKVKAALIGQCEDESLRNALQSLAEAIDAVEN